MDSAEPRVTGLSPAAERRLAFARRFLGLVSPLVPRSRRSDWRMEWEAELWHHLATAPTRVGIVWLVWRLLGAIPHALWLRGSDWRLDMLMQDLLFAWRSTRKRPGFALLVAGTLALGIGANTAMFTVVNSILIQPLPYDEPDRLVFMYGSFAKSNRAAISPPDFLDYRERNTVFSSMAARTIGGEAVLTGDGEPERIESVNVSANFFEALRVPPLHGRAFRPDEEMGPGHAVAILSFRLWQRRFGADPGIVGKRIAVNGVATEVVGVMPRLLDQTHTVELWEPLGFNGPGTSTRRFHSLRAIGRLKPTVTLAGAQTNINTIAAQLAATYPENESWSLRLLPYRDVVVGQAGRALVILLGSVGLVLLIACGNVANLLLAKATTRQGEIMIRAALGASRVRIIRQLVIESLLLAIAGGAAGLLLATAIVRGIQTVAGGILPRLAEVRVDGMVLAFTVVLSLGTGLMFGLAPALHAVRRDVTAALASMGRGSTGRRGVRLRDWLVIGQVALSVVLLVGAGLLLRSLAELHRVDPGFDPRGVLTANISLPRQRYPDRAAEQRFWNELTTALRTIPAVTTASAGTTLPLLGGGDTGYWLEGQAPTRESERRFAMVTSIAADFFATLGIGLISGREFGESDRDGAPPAIVISLSLANRVFPGIDPLGKRLVVDFNTHVTGTVVGVANDVKVLGLDSPAPDLIYSAASQSGGFGIGYLNVVLRTDGNPVLLSGPLREAVARIDPELALSDLRPMTSLVSNSTARERLNAQLIGGFAAAALLLAVIGLYGILAYAVNQRSTEIGIRLALGAARREVFGMVVGRGMVIVAIGIGVGLVAALGASRWVRGLLFQVGPTDPLVYCVVAVTLAMAGLGACLIPARRATRVDPIVALRANN